MNKETIKKELINLPQLFRANAGDIMAIQDWFDTAYDRIFHEGQGVNQLVDKLIVSSLECNAEVTLKMENCKRFDGADVEIKVTATENE